jgi:lysophospholipase L1-like esterase
MTRTKYLLFTFMAIGLAAFVSIAFLLALDVYYHHKLSTSAGLNVWGYRGPTVGRKKAGERRVVVVGESTTFGYGVHWQEAIPAYLEEYLNRPVPPSGPRVSVVNLGYNNEGAHSYKFTLQDYGYLDYDAVVLYSGYNDLGGHNTSVFRHTSPIFRLTGYFPILPIVIREKSMVIMSGGNLEMAYKGEKTVFKPNMAQRTAASALAAVATVSESLDSQLTNAMPDPTDAEAAEGAECGTRWAHYCGGMYTAVKYALDHQKKVMITTQPSINESHIDQQQRLVAFLQHRFGSNPLLRFTNLSDAVNLTDPALCYDGMHLTAAGNRVIAEKMTKPVLEMLR